MKTKILILTLTLFVNTVSFSQNDYFKGKRLYCDMPKDSESKKRFKLGIECIQRNLYIGAANKIFQELIAKDSTFCDAYFFAGYTFKISNMPEDALFMYYMADSLSNNKSIEFKQNLAALSLQIGNDTFARKKFKEMTTYFPGSPEGFYGIALSSTTIGDVDYGLININLAEARYPTENKDAQFLKAILLNLNGKYQESIVYFEKVQSEFSKDDHFNGSYALSLYEVATINNDEKMLKKARKHYDKVINKSNLTDYIKAKFEKT
ncbi:tetratricopeptide repeat protein [Flavobacterium sp.]|uniref:tetratricopeptide repeat protein n=1 Tax=Flavobacterium sp. TaxID=239 RepID=UPI0039187246